MNADTTNLSDPNSEISTFFIPLPAGKSLLPFQRDHVHRMLRLLTTNSTKSYYNADEMGLGKSIQAIACVNALCAQKSTTAKASHGYRVLILCPAVMRLVWRDEVFRWSALTIGGITEVDVVLSSKDSEHISADASTGASYTICSYDLAHRKDVLAALLKGQFDVLIMDESHYLKNRKALRTKAVLKCLWDNATYHIALSGTPFTTRIVDGFTLFHKMLPEAFPDFFAFAETFSYCREKWFSGRRVRDYYGVKNPELLSKLMRKNFYGRHTKTQVLQELPAKTFTQVTLPIQYAVEIKSKTEREELEAQAEMVRRAIENDQTVPPLPAHIARHRAAQGIAKLPPIVDFVTDLLENGVPVVLFGWHTDFLNALAIAFADYSPSFIDGSVSSKDRHEQVRRFQAGETNLFIGQYIAAGVGITLTRSSTVVLGELDWSPTNIGQAVDRTHRIGQKSAVQIFYFVVERSLDESISNAVMARSKDFKSVLDN